MLSASNARLHHMLDHHAKHNADRVGLIDHDAQSYTYSAWQGEVDQQEAWLASLDIGAGDRIMLVAENCIELTTITLAASRIDAWIMPVNARLTSGEIDRLIDHALPAIIIFTTHVSKPAQDHATRMNAIPERRMAFVRRENSAREPNHAAANQQVAALMYTTGTTGNPKGVMLSHRSFGWYARISKEFRRLTDADHTYCALPLTHIYGFASALLGNLYAGSKLELASRFDPEQVFGAFQRGATVLPAVPAMYAHLLDYAASQGWDTLPKSNLRYLMTGGAPLDPDWKRRVEEIFQLPLHNGYGMTECAPGISSSQNLKLGEETGDDISCGHPLPELDVKIVPPPGESELTNGIGEITVKGPNIMLGYYKNPEATAEILEEDGTFHTGDLGHFDAKGRLHLDGRSKELIIRSGFNVYPPEVEAALTKHPAVTLAGVVGRKVAGNEEVLAFVQAVPGVSVSEEDILIFIADELAPYKRPARIIVADSLPASSTGKILKSKLIETFQGQL